MPDSLTLLAFAGIALGLVLVPGPNMLYLISRTISQGRLAGLISLLGVALGFVFYMLCAALGITALLMAIPYAYDSLRILGALYLFYLAWQALKPKGTVLFKVEQLPKDKPLTLFMMGFLTNLLNPKVAILYLSLLPQFINVEQGNAFTQSLVLGVLQIAISISVNLLIVLVAGALAMLLNRQPIWLTAQRWFMGTVLAILAVRVLSDARH